METSKQYFNLDLFLYFVIHVIHVIHVIKVPYLRILIDFGEK